METLLLNAAIRLLEQNIALQKGERVSVVTDRKSCAIFEAVCSAVRLLGGKLTSIKISRKREHSEPLPKLARIFNQSNVIIGITDKSISHCPETRIARKRHGARVITMVEVDKALFLKAMKASIKRINAIGERLEKKLKKTRKIRIQTPSGTNASINVIRDSVGIDDGNSTKKGALNNLPFGELSMAPVNVVDGVISIDFSRICPKQKNNAKLVLNKGKIVGWNKKAERLVNYLWKAGGEKALSAVEFSFGINPAHKELLRKIIHDEKIFGSAHIAFGGYGNKRKCRIHEDLVLLKPTVFFDKTLVIKSGKIL